MLSCSCKTCVHSNLALFCHHLWRILSCSLQMPCKEKYKCIDMYVLIKYYCLVHSANSALAFWHASVSLLPLADPSAKRINPSDKITAKSPLMMLLGVSRHCTTSNSAHYKLHTGCCRKGKLCKVPCLHTQKQQIRDWRLFDQSAIKSDECLIL